jgi:polar amino acid transport system substrate-binding protein
VFKSICTLMFLVCNLSISSCVALENITIYTYHHKTPLIIDEALKKGLYYDAIRYFNSMNKEYQFNLIYLPRRRLDLMVKSNSLDGIVIGVNPLWFGDKEEKKYLWTSTLVSDVDQVISTKEKSFEYTGPDSLKNMRVGLVLGYYYYGLSELADNGLLKRDDATSEDHHFRKLLADRIDVAVISRSNYDYAMKHEPDLVGKFHTSKKPHDQFDRRILLPLKYAKVHNVLNGILQKMASDPVWRATLANYR